MFKKRKSIRLTDFNYSSAGYYFITICCRNRENYFGEIINSKVILSDIGNKASDFWMEIPEHFKHVKLDEFVIMPDHIHGILNLGSCHGKTLRNNFNHFSKPVKNSVSVIINQYKSTLKRWCNKNGFGSFQWQSRFWDRIVYDQNSIDRIRKYIRSNPTQGHAMACPDDLQSI